MNSEEMNLTPEELERYFLFESQIEAYNAAIDAITKLIHHDLFSRGGSTVALLKMLRRVKEREFEALQSKE